MMCSRKMRSQTGKKGQEARKKQGEVQRKNKQAKVDMAIESFGLNIMIHTRL